MPIKNKVLEIFGGIILLVALGAAIYFEFPSVQAAVYHIIAPLRVSSGLVGLWTFNGPDINWATNKAIDTSRTGNNGQLLSMSTSTSPVSGIVGQALQFDGSASNVNFGAGSFSFSGLSGMTATAWIKLNTVSGTQIIAGKNGPFFLKITSGKLGGSANVINTNTSGWIGLAGSQTLSVNQWYHVALTFDGLNIIQYVNGLQDSSFATTTANTLSGNGCLMIGASSGGACPATGSYLNGSIDEFRLYNRALSGGEVQWLFQQGSPSGFGNIINASRNNRVTSGLVGYWTLDGQTIDWTTNLVSDISNNGNTGQLINIATSSSPTPGIMGQALKYDSSTDRLIVQDSASLDSIDNDMTIVFWVKPNGNQVASNDFYRKNAGGGTTGFGMEDSGGAAPNLTYFAFFGNGGLTCFTNAFTLTNFTWQHVVIRKDDAIRDVFINGVDAGATCTTAATTITDNNTVLAIGNAEKATGNRGFNGFIDDFRIYNRALTNAEILYLYQRSAPELRSQVNAPQNDKFTAGLVGLWSFNGPDIDWSTGVVSDVSGSAKNGQLILMSTSTSPVSGIIGQALKFNEVNGYITAGNVFNGVQTVSFWMKSTSTTRILDLNGTASVEVISNTITANSFTSPTIYIDGAVTSTLPDGQWHHIAITTGTGINANAVDIGRISNAYFGGVLDEVRLYNRALSSSEVYALYNSGRR